MSSIRTQIALLFGSFNPIHLGHTLLANYVIEFEEIDELWLVVTPQNPLKKQNELLDEQIRLHLAKAATLDNPCLKVCDIEFSLPKPSYTIDTLLELQKLHPDKVFHLLIGSDNWSTFSMWKSYQQIIDQFKILIYPRKGDAINSSTLNYSSVKLIEAPQIEISSTFIRKAFERGADPTFLLPQSVAKEIRKHPFFLQINSKLL